MEYVMDTEALPSPSEAPLPSIQANAEYVMNPVAPPPPVAVEVLPFSAKEEGGRDVPSHLPPKQKAQANKGHRRSTTLVRKSCLAKKKKRNITSSQSEILDPNKMSITSEQQKLIKPTNTENALEKSQNFMASYSQEQGFDNSSYDACMKLAGKKKKAERSMKSVTSTKKVYKTLKNRASLTNSIGNISRRNTRKFGESITDSSGTVVTEKNLIKNTEENLSTKQQNPDLSICEERDGPLSLSKSVEDNPVFLTKIGTSMHFDEILTLLPDYCCFLLRSNEHYYSTFTCPKCSNNYMTVKLGAMHYARCKYIQESVKNKKVLVSPPHIVWVCNLCYSTFDELSTFKDHDKNCWLITLFIKTYNLEKDMALKEALKYGPEAKNDNTTKTIVMQIDKIFPLLSDTCGFLLREWEGGEYVVKCPKCGKRFGNLKSGSMHYPTCRTIKCSMQNKKILVSPPYVAWICFMCYSTFDELAKQNNHEKLCWSRSKLLSQLSVLELEMNKLKSNPVYDQDLFQCVNDDLSNLTSEFPSNCFSSREEESFFLKVQNTDETAGTQMDTIFSMLPDNCGFLLRSWEWEEYIVKCPKCGKRFGNLKSGSLHYPVCKTIQWSMKKEKTLVSLPHIAWVCLLCYSTFEELTKLNDHEKVCWSSVQLLIKTDNLDIDMAPNDTLKSGPVYDTQFQIGKDALSSLASVFPSNLFICREEKHEENNLKANMISKKTNAGSIGPQSRSARDVLSIPIYVSLGRRYNSRDEEIVLDNLDLVHQKTIHSCPSTSSQFQSGGNNSVIPNAVSLPNTRQGEGAIKNFNMVPQERLYSHPLHSSQFQSVGNNFEIPTAVSLRNPQERLYSRPSHSSQFQSVGNNFGSSTPVSLPRSRQESVISNVNVIPQERFYSPSSHSSQFQFVGNNFEIPTPVSLPNSRQQGAINNFNVVPQERLDSRPLHSSQF